MTFHDANFGCAVRIHGDGCPHYHVAFRVPETIGSPLPDAPIGALLGDGIVHRPDGKSSVSGWVGRKLDMMLERDVVDSALSDALGEVGAPADRLRPDHASEHRHRAYLDHHGVAAQ